MLSEIRLDFFKCFNKLRLPLKPLTLLTGTNASGKSTVIQSLVLLHQTMVDTYGGPALILDGSLLSLGTLGDVVDKVNGRRQFSIGLSLDSVTVTWTFESSTSDRRDISVPLATVEVISQEKTTKEEHPLVLIPELQPGPNDAFQSLLKTLTYISAERMGPRETYMLQDPLRHRTIGPKGERAPGKLYWYQDDLVEGILRSEHETVPNLYKQAQAWLAEFFPGASFDVQRIPGANLVTLGIRTSTDTDYHRPQHVGFGITHLLPILVACLHARRGDLVIIENPEVHLHPRGQAMVGLFLARAAAAGVQVLIETHSDHLLNGIRRAVRSSLLAPEDVAIHFFQPRAVAEAQSESQILSPLLDRQGNIDRWPKGFFDQFEKDMNHFAGLGE